MFLLPKREPSFQDKVEIALGNPNRFPPHLGGDMDYNFQIYQFALRVGVQTDGQWLFCHDFPLRLMADKLRVDTEIRPGLTASALGVSVLVPLWFVGAFWWNIGLDLWNWWELSSLEANKIKADAVFRRMSRKLKPYVTERGQHLLLTEVMLAKTDPGPKAVAQVYLRAALDTGMPKPKRIRGR